MSKNHREEKPLLPDDEAIYITPDKVEEIERLLENMDKTRYELKKAIERVKPFGDKNDKKQIK